MRTHSPLVIDIQELLDNPRTPRHLRFTEPVPELEIGLSKVADPVAFDLSFEALDGGVLVQGTLTGRLAGSCRRCLRPVGRAFEIEGAEMYRPPSDAWEEGYVLSDTALDLDPMARDLIGLEIPLDSLCRPDCAGLCPRCGADLNEGPCDCPEEIDPRWSQLDELSKKLYG